LEAENKNFILLAQSDLPLGYGPEFKPIETLEPIFKNHPSWISMKRVLTHGSRWPLQPLSEENQIKDFKDALIFGNHKDTVQQQDLLRKLVTDNIV
jgi:hypothetical protein